MVNAGKAKAKATGVGATAVQHNITSHLVAMFGQCRVAGEF